MNTDEMKKLAERTVGLSISKGAETAEVTVKNGTDIEVMARKGAIEHLSESSSSRIMISISRDQRRAMVTSSDLSPDSIEQLISEAVELTSVMDFDPCFSLPEAGELGRHDEDLDLFDRKTVELPAKEIKKIALRLERETCGLDKRIISDGASFSNGAVKTCLANSIGFCDAFEKTFAYMGISCAAEDSASRGENIGKKQSYDWFTSAVSCGQLAPIDDVASIAVERTLRKLGAVKPKTCEVPVVFDPECGRLFLGSIASAVSGGSIYRKASFLVDMIGEEVGSKHVTILDDPLLPGRLGSRPFDAEGVRSRRNKVFKKGVLESYLLDTYQAKKLGRRTTGSSGGASNFYLEPGVHDPDEIIAGIDEGLYLTALSGPGANWTTGDFSQGAQGIWIEQGELSYAVNEFTVAGTFTGMLAGISVVCTDIDWKRPVASPTFMINRMTVSGT